MDSSKHTATPWHVEHDSKIYAAADGVMLASTWTRHVCDDREEGESWLQMRERTKAQRIAAVEEEAANAAFIVRAVNSHDQMAEALTDAIDRIKSAYNLLGCDDEFIEREVSIARAALAAAGA